MNGFDSNLLHKQLYDNNNNNNNVNAIIVIQVMATYLVVGFRRNDIALP